jgi:hypothetical protein
MCILKEFDRILILIYQVLIASPYDFDTNNPEQAESGTSVLFRIEFIYSK